METICLMVNGIPGKVALTVASHVINDKRFEIVPFSLTGAEIPEETCQVNGLDITLVRPDEREQVIQDIKTRYPSFISIDFTHPTAVNSNAQFYVTHLLPFVMGTTGGDRDLLEKTVLKGSIPAVIAPNMAKQIVGFQAMMDYAAKTFPDLFKGYSLAIEESHQQGKADTSGTAKAMVTYYNALGIPFSEESITKERNPEIQQDQWGVPEKYLSGHGWHTYTLEAPDKSAFFQFKHNINGRDIYVQGTLDGVLYLNDKMQKEPGTGTRGKVFTMIDVLKG